MLIKGYWLIRFDKNTIADEKREIIMQEQKASLLKKDHIFLNTYRFECNNIYNFDNNLSKPEFSITPLFFFN